MPRSPDLPPGRGGRVLLADGAERLGEREAPGESALPATAASQPARGERRDRRARRSRRRRSPGVPDCDHLVQSVEVGPGERAVAARARDEQASDAGLAQRSRELRRAMSSDDAASSRRRRPSRRGRRSRRRARRRIGDRLGREKRGPSAAVPTITRSAPGVERRRDRLERAIAAADLERQRAGVRDALDERRGVGAPENAPSRSTRWRRARSLGREPSGELDRVAALDRDGVAPSLATRRTARPSRTSIAGSTLEASC